MALTTGNIYSMTHFRASPLLVNHFLFEYLLGDLNEINTAFFWRVYDSNVHVSYYDKDFKSNQISQFVTVEKNCIVNS